MCYCPTALRRFDPMEVITSELRASMKEDIADATLSLKTYKCVSIPLSFSNNLNCCYFRLLFFFCKNN